MSKYSTGAFVGRLLFTILLNGAMLASALGQLPPEVIFSETLTTNPGWSSEGAWAFGTPSGGGSPPDPTAGYSGTNVYGYNLSGNYPDNLATTHYLTTPPINCSNFSQVVLSFQRWLGIESKSWDTATIDVSTNGTTWTNLWVNPFSSILDTQWTNFTLNLSSVAATATSVQIRWGLGPTDSSVNFAGWNIDDVELRGLSSTSEYANIATSIRESEDPALTGSNLLYTATISNLGPFVAAGLVSTSTFHPSVALLSVTNANGLCTITGLSVICSFTSILPGSSETIQILTLPGSGGIVTATTAVAAVPWDSNLSNNRATETTLVSGMGGAIFLRTNLVTAQEGSVVTVQVRRTGNVYGGVQIGYGTSNSTAEAGSDFALTTGTLTFASGSTQTSFAISILDDVQPESDEAFSVHLFDPTGGATAGVPALATITIPGNDLTATFPFSDTFDSSTFSNYWTAYSTAGGRIQITTNYSPYSPSNHVTFDSTSGSFALNEITLTIDLAGRDGVALRFWQKEFSDEDTALPTQFTGHANGDGVSVNLDGTNWYRLINLTAAVSSNSYQHFELPLDGLVMSNGLSYSSQSRIRFQQYDNSLISSDGFAFDDIEVASLAGAFQFASNSFSVDESAAVYTATVLRLGGSAGTSAVSYSVLAGSASNGPDFIEQTGVLTFASGQVTNLIEIAISNDETNEGPETVLLSLFEPVGGPTLGAITNAILTIQDDDGPGSVSFSQATYSFSEQAMTATMTVTRAGGVAGTITVDYALEPLSATPGFDYQSTSGTLIFTGGQTYAWFPVTILNDDLIDPGEEFLAFLSNPTGGATIFSPTSAVATILDDELSYFQGFEGTANDNWNFVATPGAGQISTNSTTARTGTNSLELRGSNFANSDPSIVFDNVDLSIYSNVYLSIAFGALGPDTSDDLHLDLSYDNGSTWTGTGSIKLVDGYSNADIPFNTTALLDPATVSTNPWVVAIPDSADQIRVRVRFDERSDANGTLDGYFVDDIRLYYLPPSQPPLLDAPETLLALVSNHASFLAHATDEIDHDPISLTASNMPPGTTFSVTTNVEGDVSGFFSFTAEVSQADSVYTTLLYAADKDGTTTQSVVISVQDRVVFLSQIPAVTDEGDGTLAITVSISRAAGTAVDIHLEGSATLGEDYTISSTSLVFTAGGPLEQSVTLEINDDAFAEGEETWEPVLVNCTSGAVGQASIAMARLRDNDSFTLAAANLSSSGQRYRDPGNRILEAAKPDILAIQEFNVTDATYRDYVDRIFGTDYHFVCETNRTLPNGIISRWPVLASGQWDDVLLSDREFLWATIDLPGDRDLHLVSVHLYYSGGASAREAEASNLVTYIQAAGFDTNDFLAICGDFNTQTREESAIVVLTQVVSDIRKPADQLGDTDSNKNRNYPYDRVLPNPLLDSAHLPLQFGGMTFPEGIVFDTRLWTNPPPPALTGDSDTTEMQHLLVMKLFSTEPPIAEPVTSNGVPIWWLVQHGWTGEFDAVAFGDQDNDRIPTWQEYFANTVPTNPASVLRIEEVSGSFMNHEFIITWQSASSRVYEISASTNNLQEFTPILQNLTSTPGLNIHTLNVYDARDKLYRVRIQP